MSKPRLVLIGNGMAGVRTVEELLKIKPDHYDITIFGAEPHPNYNRILLSPVLAGEMTIQEIVLNELDWYKERASRCTPASRSPRSTASTARSLPTMAPRKPTTAC